MERLGPAPNCDKPTSRPRCVDESSAGRCHRLEHYAPARTDCDYYGFRTSDSDFDGWIWAFMYGAVSLGGLFRHALGVPSGEHVYLTPSAGILPVPSLI